MRRICVDLKAEMTCSTVVEIEDDAVIDAKIGGLLHRLALAKLDAGEAQWETDIAYVEFWDDAEGG